jgi:hypothetical protein
MSKHYFLVDHLTTVYEHSHRFSAWEFVAQEHTEFPSDDEPVILWVIFGNIHIYHVWNQVEGVHELPDPLEGEPLEHRHMHRLKRVHGHTHQDHKDGTTTWHAEDGTEVERPTTKKTMNTLAKTHWPSFRFKIF